MAAVQVGPDAIKQAAIRTDFPIEEGLTFGTQTQEGNVSNLVIQEESLVDPRETEGL